MMTMTDELKTRIFSSNVRGWTAVDEGASGSFYWMNPNYDFVIYATPDWDREGETPFAVMFENPYKVFIQGFTPNAEYFTKLSTIIDLAESFTKKK